MQLNTGGTTTSVSDTLNTATTNVTSILNLRPTATVVGLNSSTWTNLFTMTSGKHGFLKLNCSSGASVSSMLAYFFDYTGNSYPSLTLMASSGNSSTQGTNGVTSTNTGTGTQQILVQVVAGVVQAKSVLATMNVAVRITYF